MLGLRRRGPARRDLTIRGADGRPLASGPLATGRQGDLLLAVAGHPDHRHHPRARAMGRGGSRCRPPLPAKRGPDAAACPLRIPAAGSGGESLWTARPKSGGGPGRFPRAAIVGLSSAAHAEERFGGALRFLPGNPRPPERPWNPRPGTDVRHRRIRGAAASRAPARLVHGQPAGRPAQAKPRTGGEIASISRASRRSFSVTRPALWVESRTSTRFQTLRQSGW